MFFCAVKTAVNTAIVVSPSNRSQTPQYQGLQLDKFLFIIDDQIAAGFFIEGIVDYSHSSAPDLLLGVIMYSTRQEGGWLPAGIYSINNRLQNKSLVSSCKRRDCKRDKNNKENFKRRSLNLIYSIIAHGIDVLLEIKWILLSLVKIAF